MKYFVLYAPTEKGYSAHVPELPECIAAATLEETRRLMKAAIEFRVEGMRLYGDLVPAPVPVGEELELLERVREVTKSALSN